MLAVVVALIAPTVASGQDYTFGDWARDQGYSPGEVMPEAVVACWPPCSPEIDSLDGIGEFDWTTTPTTELWLLGSQISNIKPGDFNGLTNLEHLILLDSQISNIKSGAFNGLTNLTTLELLDSQISNIKSGAFSGLTNLELLSLYGNQLSSIESGAFSRLVNLTALQLGGNTALTELNLVEADFLSLHRFSVQGDENISNVSLKNTVMNQTSLASLLDGGGVRYVGIGYLDGITEMDLSGIDFVDITDLSPLYVMDDLTDLWLVDTENVDASDLDLLLDNLEIIEGTDTEGILHMTHANFDVFNAAGGGLLAAWNAEPGHHVAFVIPEPSTLLLALAALGVVGGWRKWKAYGRL
jgi:Leucine-rich repeat (LRR) protein